MVLLFRSECLLWYPDPGYLYWSRLPPYCRVFYRHLHGVCLQLYAEVKINILFRECFDHIGSQVVVIGF